MAAITVRELLTRLDFDYDRGAVAGFNKLVGDAVKGSRGLTRQLDLLSGKLMQVGKHMTLGVTLPIAAAGTFAVTTNAKVQKAMVAFTAFTGSAEAAATMLDQLFRFAAKTPFTIPDVIQNAKQLMGMGFAMEEVIPTMRMLGDVAAGTDTPIERIVRNFGQVRNLNKLMKRDLNDFARAGIPILDELAKNLGVSKERVLELITAGKVSFDDVNDAFRTMTGEGGRFHNLMQEQAKTTAGLWSNLFDAFFRVLNIIGKMIVEELYINEILQFLIDSVDKIIELLQSMPKWVRKIVLGFFLFVAILGPAIFLLGAFLKVMIMTFLAFKALTFVLGLFGLSLAPVLLAVGILAAKLLFIVAVIAIVHDELKGWSEGADSLLGELSGRTMPEFVKDMADLRDDILRILDDIKERGFQGLVDGVKHMLETLKIFITDLMEEWKEAISGFGNIPFLRLLTAFAPLPEDPGARAAMLEGIISPAELARIRGQQGQGPSINVNSTIEMTIPEGTPEQQKTFVEDAAKKAVRDEFSKQVDHVMNDNSLFVEAATLGGL